MRLDPPAIALDSGPRPDAARVREVARDLEAQFAHMLVKSMRATTGGDPFGGSDTTFRDMQDEQLARNLTRGRGLGLAPLIERQLGGGDAAEQSARLRAGQAFSLEGYPRPAPARRPDAEAAADPTAVARQAAAERLRALENGVVDAAPMARLVALETAFGGERPARAGRDEGPGGTTIAGILAARRAREAATGDVADPSRFDRGSREAFVAAIWPHAQRAAQELGVCPKVVVAQAALETGWGRSTIRARGQDANNYFGIKAGRGWNGDSVGARTREVVGGREVTEHARFRAYGSIAESVADYTALLKNSPRYADVVGQSDTRRFAAALQRAGYATDPRYAQKLTAIAEGPALAQALAAIGATPPRG